MILNSPGGSTEYNGCFQAILERDSNVIETLQAGRCPLHALFATGNVGTFESNGGAASSSIRQNQNSRLLRRQRRNRFRSARPLDETALWIYTASQPRKPKRAWSREAQQRKT